MSVVNLQASLIDGADLTSDVQSWKRDNNRTLVVTPDTIVSPEYFPAIGPGDYLDLSLNYYQWLEGGDQIINGYITVSNVGLGLAFAFMRNPYFTAWVSGGVCGQTYGITYVANTLQGRTVERTAWLRIVDVTPAPPIQ